MVRYKHEEKIIRVKIFKKNNTVYVENIYLKYSNYTKRMSFDIFHTDHVIL